MKKFISNQELYFIKANEIIKKITINEEAKNSQNLKNEDQTKINDGKSKKKENKKIPFQENINHQKKKTD